MNELESKIEKPVKMNFSLMLKTELTGFLELSSSLIEEHTVGGVAASHTEVTGFTADPYLVPPNRAKITDILTQATLCAFYSD